MKLKKIVISIILLIVLLTNTGYKAYAAADPAVVEIIGGSIAAGGIAATAAAIFPPAMIIVGLVMVAQGIDIALTEASEEAGMTKTEFIGAKFEEFCDATRQDFDLMCNRIALQTQILQDGSILLAEEASSVIGMFINNLLANEQIIVASEAGEYLIVEGQSLPVIYRDEILQTYTLNNGDVYALKNASDSAYALCAYNPSNGVNKGIYIITTNSRVRFSTYSNGFQSVQDYSYIATWANGLYYYKCQGLTSDVKTIDVPILQNFPQSIENLNGDFTLSNGSPDVDSFVSDDLASIDTSVLNPSSGYQNVINPGLEIPGLASGNDGIVSVRDYIDALGKAIDGVQDLSIAVQDAYTGVITDVQVGAYDVTRDVSLTTEEEDEDTVATPLVDAQAMPTGSEAEEALQNLQFDLTAIFPFCIPFDLYALIQKFDVSPASPAMHIAIPLGGIAEDLEFDLDLAPWEPVARVLRTMELIAFVVGLAMVTRQIIRG